MNTITTVAAVARITPSPARTPYEVFAIGLDRLYTMPLSLDETTHSRFMAIDRYIDSNGWSWETLIEESEKPDININ